jgi:hypothetical protein
MQTMTAFTTFTMVTPRTIHYSNPFLVSTVHKNQLRLSVGMLTKTGIGGVKCGGVTIGVHNLLCLV